MVFMKFTTSYYYAFITEIFSIKHTGSADLEEEDFEIVQSLMSKPVHQTASKEFDFFHPDPFVDCKWDCYLISSTLI